MSKRALRINFDANDDTSLEDNEILEEESEDEETAENKRRRLAKQYVSKLKSVYATNGTEADEVDGAISQHLKKERMIRDGKATQDDSEFISTLDMSTETSRQCNNASITCLCLSTDQNFVYTGSKDNSLIKWDCETGESINIKDKWKRDIHDSFQSHDREILSVAVTSDGRYLASGGRDNQIHIFDARIQYGEIQTLRGHKSAVSGLVFQENSDSLFSSSFDGSIKYWQLNDMCCFETLFGHQDEVQAIDCSSKQRVLSGGTDRSVRYWKVDHGSHLVFRAHKGSVDAVKILDDSTYISGGQDGRLNAWKDSSKFPMATVENAHGKVGNESWISSLATLSSTNVFASGSDDGFVKLWSVSERNIRCINKCAINGFVNGLAMSESLLVIGSSKEHRLGTWWNKKSCKDKITFLRYRNSNS